MCPRIRKIQVRPKFISPWLETLKENIIKETEKFYSLNF